MNPLTGRYEMSSAQQPQTRTRMFARVLGPFFVILAVMAVVRAADMRPMVSEFASNPLWPWLLGGFNLLLGLVIIALHQYWRGAAAIVVSVLGWLLALRGLFIMAFPQTAISLADNMIGATTFTLSRTGFVVLAAVGLYLTYVGWVPAVSRPMTHHAGRSTTNLSRAA